MKRVSQAPWFIVLCVSISVLSLRDTIYTVFLSLSSDRAGSLSLSGLARARVKSDARALVSLSAPAGPRAGARWPTNYLYCRAAS